MNVINYRVSLDMLDTSSQATIKAKKGDSACKIYITLSQNGKIYKMSKGSHATFSAKKSDGTFVLYDKCDIEGDSIVYDFLSSVNDDGCQITACAGTVECEVTLFNGSEQLTSPRFTLVVDGTVYNGEEIVSSDEANALKDLINEAEDTITEASNIVAEIENKLENGEFKGDKGDKGEQGLQGEKGKDAVTDQEFNPTSESAQSGKAVKQAIDYYTFSELLPEMYGHEISGIVSPSAVVNYVNDYAEQKPNYTLVYTTTLTEATAKVSNKVEDMLDSTKPIIVKVIVPPNTTFSNNYVALQFSFPSNRGISVRGNNWKTSTSNTVGVWECKQRNNIWDVTVAPYDKQVTTIDGDLMLLASDKIRYANVTAGGDLPVGTIIEIWGTPK